MKEKIIISGAGLCGSLLGTILAIKNQDVTIYERRGDLRKNKTERGRSINLALSIRGIEALKLAGIEDEVKEISIPMYGRGIHMPDGSFQTFPYSGRAGEYINSISRTDLNAALMNAFERIRPGEIHFSHTTEQVDFESNKITLRSYDDNQIKNEKFGYLFGTDGANSAVRKSLFEKSHFSYTYSQQFLDYGYKELLLPADHKGAFKLDKNVLHIWPRGYFMMIALPNLDGSFTVTLFLPMKGSNSFEMIDNSEGIIQYFDKNFKGISYLFEDLEKQYFDNPIGMLGTIKCYPWTDDNSTIILGDAAHAIVPFYGQGMNAAFEDVHVFADLLNKYGAINIELLQELQELRKPNTDAIADLAIDNFYEMRDRTGDAIFQAKRQLETKLEKVIPGYFSKYSLVTFRHDIPYHTAMIKGRKQDEWLMDYCALHPEILDEDLPVIAEELFRL